MEIKYCVNGHPLTEENTVYLKRGKDKPKRKRCRLCVSERIRKYRNKIRESLRPIQREYSRNHYGNNSEKVKRAVKDYRQKCKSIVFEHYGNKCNCCGESMREFLCIDHIFNNGSEHRKQEGIGGGVEIYRWLINNNFPEGFQILCYNCNAAKAYYGVCPHQKPHMV